jgi:hypothetical protein
MATNPLSTTFGGVEGEGFIKFEVAATASAVGKVLPDQFNEECFVEIYAKQGTGYGVFYVYNPGGTSAPVRVLANSSTVGTAGADVPVVQAALSSGTVNGAHILYFYKDATSGKCQVRQTANATFAAATVWIRKVG